jgi:hypothetical protein
MRVNFVLIDEDNEGDRDGRLQYIYTPNVSKGSGSFLSSTINKRASLSEKVW